VVYKYMLIWYLLISFQFSQAQNTSLNFSLEDLNGKNRMLSEFTDKGPVYINFWALWCQPCRAELKTMQAIYEKYSEKGFTLLAISIDTPRSLAKVKSFFSSQNFTMPCLLDPNSKVFEKLNGQSLPYSILIDKSGKIAKTRTGYLPGDEKFIEQDIVKILQNE